MAIGNLAAEAENHGEIVKLGAIEILVALACTYSRSKVVTKHVSTSDTANTTSTPFRSDSNVTTRHNQFGFGNNHIVPSVPIPPFVQQQVVRHQNVSTTTGATVVPPKSPSIVGTPNNNTNTI